MAESLGNVVNNWRVRNQSTVTATENGRVRIKTECFINSANGYWFSGLNVHGGAAVNGQWSTVDRTNLSIAQNSGVGLVAKEIWVNRTKVTQSILCTAEARVSGFAAGTSKSDLRISVPPLPSHTVSYNANGGSGAPASQTKWWGEVLTLSTTRPTRANHTFLGWATSAGGAVAYQPCGRYGADNNVTLYAIWKLNAVAPSITNFTCVRCTQDGTESDSGTYFKLTATWKIDTVGDTSNTCRTLVFGYQQTDGAWVDWPAAATSGTGATTSIVKGVFDPDLSWRFRCVLTDKYASTTVHAIVGAQAFIIDITSDGAGIGIGTAAPKSGVSIAGSPVTVNGLRIPRIYRGSIVVSPTGSSTRHTLFTADQWLAITGSPITDSNTGGAVVTVSNGDVDARNVGCGGAGYSHKNRQWYVYLTSAVSAVFRVNYVIII